MVTCLARSFFEYQSLDELVDYFLKEHSQKIQQLMASSNREQVGSDTDSKTSTTISRAQKTVKQNRFLSPLNPKSTPYQIEDIAIIGLSGRFPGARNMNAFWENLKNGVDSITEIPKDRWELDHFFDPDKSKAGSSYSKWGGFIDGVDEFDPLFFNISPREAELMDPQERLFLQTAWEAIEDAGYSIEDFQMNASSPEGPSGQVGVYTGVMYEEYQLFGAEERLKGNPVVTIGSPSSIANRVSYFFNLHGPSMAVDTMCSSSLTAIHLACQDLKSGKTKIAIAGGVNVSLHPNKYLWLSQARFASSKGRCESFGQGGDGYVPGEGVGAVILKPLSKAQADGDRIYGIIKSSSLNHGGKTNGYTVPNPKAQTALIRESIERAGVKAEDFSYIEAHGTGTSLGDPIEIAGLSKAFQTDQQQYCAIGSVKSNIGHAESAAGIAGLAKVLLQLKHQQLVPSLHSTTLNPHIDFEQTPFHVQQQLQEWKSEKGKPRLAGISSFGAGGSNAHLIIEEYQEEQKEAYHSAGPAIILLSAKNKERLIEQVKNLNHFLKQNHTLALHEIAYTLQMGRTPMPERFAVLISTREALLEELDNYLNGRSVGLSGNINEDKNNFVLKGKAGEAYIQKAMKEKEAESLAQLWIKGVNIDWNLLYPAQKPKKVSLPTYPFERRSYWIPTTELASPFTKIHPLLHRNTSNFQEQRFQ